MSDNYDNFQQTVKSEKSCEHYFSKLSTDKFLILSITGFVSYQSTSSLHI